MQIFTGHARFAPPKFGVTRLLLSLWVLLCLSALAPARAQTTTVPIEIRDTLIFVPVEINGKPAKFLLDTGAFVNMVTPQAAERLGLKSPDEKKFFNIIGAGSTVQNVPAVSLGEYRVGSLTYTDQEAVVIDFPAECDGVLGAPFLSQQIVVINYQRKILQLISDKNYTPSGSWLPLQIVNDLPCVKLRFGEYQGYFRMDTGAANSLIIHTPFVEEKKLRDVFKIIGTNEAQGIGGAITGDLVLLPTVTLGDIKGWPLSNVMTVLSLQTTGALAEDFISGNIGGEIWQQFTVTLDYARHMAAIKANAMYYKDWRNAYPSLLARSGFLEVGGEVMDVLPDSPAAEAGIVIGDRLTAIDGKARGDISTAEFLAIMKQPVGTQLRLKLRSVDDAEREVTLILRDLT